MDASTHVLAIERNWGHRVGITKPDAGVVFMHNIGWKTWATYATAAKILNMMITKNRTGIAK